MKYKTTKRGSIYRLYCETCEDWIRKAIPINEVDHYSRYHSFTTHPTDPEPAYSIERA